jgi:hypothetical protein
MLPQSASAFCELVHTREVFCDPEAPSWALRFILDNRLSILKSTGERRASSRNLSLKSAPDRRRFQKLADVPPEIEWFANITNPSTRRAYEAAIQDFMRFTGINRPKEFRTVTRAHVIAWRDDLAGRMLGGRAEVRTGLVWGFPCQGARELSLSRGFGPG